MVDNREDTVTSLKVPSSPQKKSSRKRASAKVTKLVPQEGVASGGCGQELLKCGGLDKEKLLSILKGYGEYPEKYR